MANDPLTNNFATFFNHLNPSPSIEQTASREYATVKGLIEDPRGLVAELSPVRFLQGSSPQQTAIYPINDVDIVTLCELWEPSTGNGGGRSCDRDAIFAVIADLLLNYRPYKGKIRYTPSSMCFKVDHGIKIELLPVMYKQGNNDPQGEPKRLRRLEHGRWKDG